MGFLCFTLYFDKSNRVGYTAITRILKREHYVGDAYVPRVNLKRWWNWTRPEAENRVISRNELKHISQPFKIVSHLDQTRQQHFAHQLNFTHAQQIIWIYVIQNRENVVLNPRTNEHFSLNYRLDYIIHISAAEKWLKVQLYMRESIFLSFSAC